MLTQFHSLHVQSPMHAYRSPACVITTNGAGDAGMKVRSCHPSACQLGTYGVYCVHARVSSTYLIYIVYI